MNKKRLFLLIMAFIFVMNCQLDQDDGVTVKQNKRIRNRFQNRVNGAKKGRIFSNSGTRG